MKRRVVGSIPFRLLASVAFLCSVCAAQSGYFRVEQREGVWWLIDPDGEPTLSIGVNHIVYEGDRIQGTGPSPYMENVQRIYPDRNTWGLMTLARIRLWGFNTIAAWSDSDLWDRGIPYTVILDIAAHAGADWQRGKPVDVYAPEFEKAATDIAVKECATRAQDKFLIGYFSDNELRWGPDWRGKETMLEMYLKLAPEAPGRQQAVSFLRQRYGNDIQQLSRVWNIRASSFEQISAAGETDAFRADANEFLARVAARYFEVCARAMREADPNHLFLGARFAGRVPEPVIRAARISDVVSVNVYEFDPRATVKHVIELTGRPVMVTEFSFRAGPRVPNQAARAKAYADFVLRLASLPEVVGYHWFQWVDQPREGRFDGENSNYGLVDLNDNPYAEFIGAVRVANLVALEVHKNAGR